MMTIASSKPCFLKNALIRALLFSLLLIFIRFAYVVTIRGESCAIADFCFSPSTTTANFKTRSSAVAVSSIENREFQTSKDSVESVRFYSSIFQDLLAEGILSPDSKSLCVVETLTERDVLGLKQIGVEDAIGVTAKSFKPLVVSGLAHQLPFEDDTFDFIFSGGGEVDRLKETLGFAAEVGRSLKPGGVFVVHANSSDEYSFNSFVDLFNCCRVVRVRDIDGFESSMPRIREIVMRKELGNQAQIVDNGGEARTCDVPGYKQKLVRIAEPLIEEEPLKPWLTLKRNIKNVKYLTTMADINYKARYVYVDVGARSYGSSIGSWFKKQYPKQNKTFEVYAIEADKAFHDEYKLKKNVKLLPYAAWVRNESLVFEVNRDPGQDKDAKGRGMGRIKPVAESKHGLASDVNEIQGFDFAEWLKSTVTEKDFVVMKMDVEGTEFDLIPRLFETGAICLVDEVFLECHYNRWQKCCPGERSPKYEKTYNQCLELFTSLRQSGVLVHQWW